MIVLPRIAKKRSRRKRQQTAEKGVVVSQKVSRDAIEWFVLNESGAEPSEAGALDWEQWCVVPGNNAEYVGILELALQLRALPPPELPSREVLRADAEADALELTGGARVSTDLMSLRASRRS
jgi:hypothetical protein